MIAKITQTSVWNPIITWIFAIGILFLNEMYRGYKYHDLTFGIFGFLVSKYWAFS